MMRFKKKLSTKLINFFENSILYETQTISQSRKSNVLCLNFKRTITNEEAKKCPELVALHSRLKLSNHFSYKELLMALNCKLKDNGVTSNYGMMKLGMSTLEYYISEFLMVKYPRLPLAIQKSIIKCYARSDVLYEIGKFWGLEVDKRSELEKHLSQQPEYMDYGKIRYLSDQKKEAFVEKGVTKLTNFELKSQMKNGEIYISEEVNAYASAVYSILGVMTMRCGDDIVKKFIHENILSRKLLLESMFQFSKPFEELSRLCYILKYKLPVKFLLMAETGRLSSNPIFLVGVFHGNEILGQSVGSSLIEAKTRACVNTLISYYLYSPLNQKGEPAKLPSDENYTFESLIDFGDIIS